MKQILESCVEVYLILQAMWIILPSSLDKPSPTEPISAQLARACPGRVLINAQGFQHCVSGGSHNKAFYLIAANGI